MAQAAARTRALGFSTSEAGILHFRQGEVPEDVFPQPIIELGGIIIGELRIKLMAPVIGNQTETHGSGFKMQTRAFKIIKDNQTDLTFQG